MMGFEHAKRIWALWGLRCVLSLQLTHLVIIAYAHLAKTHPSICYLLHNKKCHKQINSWGPQTTVRACAMTHVISTIPHASPSLTRAHLHSHTQRHIAMACQLQRGLCVVVAHSHMHALLLLVHVRTVRGSCTVHFRGWRCCGWSLRAQVGVLRVCLCLGSGCTRLGLAAQVPVGKWDQMIRV